ncbi:MAG: MFS transporter [Proteobacteria bacterium]|nr:MFS transporter [Pseudomonadota bacterium]
MAIADEYSRNFRRAVVIFIALNLLYQMSTFFRSTNAVIAESLRSDFGASSEQLSLVTSAYFFAFALMQIPVGGLLDRFGPRRMISIMMLIPAIGAIVFASAESVSMLVLGEILMGGGCAVGLMGAVVVFARWFRPSATATMIALYTGFGNLGFLLSSTPLALMAAAIGWRGSFALMAVVTAFLVLIAFLFVRDAPRGHAYHEREPESFRQIMAGIREILSKPQMYLVLALSFPSLSIILTIRALWAGPYLADVHGLDQITASEMIFLVTVFMLIGNILYGPLDRIFNSRKWVVLPGAFATVLILTVLAVMPDMGLYTVVGLLCALALVCNYIVTLMAHGCALFPDRLIGRAITMVNFANFAGIAILQAASGALIGLFPHDGAGAAPETAYRAMFAFLALCTLAGAIAYLFVRDSKPSDHGRA